MILGITYDDNTSSTGFDLSALGHGLDSVVCALGVEVRMDFADDGTNIFFREDEDRVNVGESGQNFSALLGWDHGTSFAF